MGAGGLMKFSQGPGNSSSVSQHVEGGRGHPWPLCFTRLQEKPTGIQEGHHFNPPLSAMTSLGPKAVWEALYMYFFLWSLLRLLHQCQSASFFHFIWFWYSGVYLPFSFCSFCFQSLIVGMSQLRAAKPSAINPIAEWSVHFRLHQAQENLQIMQLPRVRDLQFNMSLSFLHFVLSKTLFGFLILLTGNSCL